jgi:hypothetical protein
MEHLLADICIWKANGEEVLLYMDVNEHIYTGRFGRALLDPEINMKEQFFSVTGQYAPASHFWGERPITGLFATAGLQFTNIFQSAHKSGIGDHRYTIYDLDAYSATRYTPPSHECGAARGEFQQSYGAAGRSPPHVSEAS